LNAFSTISEIGIAGRSIVDSLPSSPEKYKQLQRDGETAMKDLYGNKYEALRLPFQDVNF
jgi:hypothetical protein